MINSKNFKIEDGELFYLHSNGPVKWGSVDNIHCSYDNPEFAFTPIPFLNGESLTCGTLTSESCEEIRDLLNRLDERGRKKGIKEG